MKEAIGMSNCVYAITGAPINPDILRLFHTLDIHCMRYGMTETTAGASLGYKKNHNFGTVGKPFSTELMISDSEKFYSVETYNERILQKSRG